MLPSNYWAAEIWGMEWEAERGERGRVNKSLQKVLGVRIASSHARGNAFFRTLMLSYNDWAVGNKYGELGEGGKGKGKRRKSNQSLQKVLGAPRI